MTQQDTIHALMRDLLAIEENRKPLAAKMATMDAESSRLKGLLARALGGYDVEYGPATAGSANTKKIAGNPEKGERSKGTTKALLTLAADGKTWGPGELCKAVSDIIGTRASPRSISATICSLRGRGRITWEGKRLALAEAT